MNKPDKLREFYTDKAMMSAVAELAQETLKETALQRVFKGDDVVGIKEARDTIIMIFNKLESKFGVRKKKKNVNQSE